MQCRQLQSEKRKKKSFLLLHLLIYCNEFLVLQFHFSSIQHHQTFTCLNKERRTNHVFTSFINQINLSSLLFLPFCSIPSFYIFCSLAQLHQKCHCLIGEWHLLCQPQQIYCEKAFLGADNNPFS